MATSESDEKGYPDAHTPAAPGVAEAAQGDAAAEQLALIDGSPDLLDADAIAVAAEFVAAPRRGRGRPKGSANKRNDDMMAYLQALGHRDPAVTLSMIQTASTVALAKMLGSIAEGDDGKPVLDKAGNPVIIPADPLKVLAVQQRAASDLMAYFYAKKPQQLELPEGGERRAFMAIGELHGDVYLAAGGTMSAGIPPQREAEKANEINGAICDKTSVCLTEEKDE